MDANLTHLIALNATLIQPPQPLWKDWLPSMTTAIITAFAAVFAVYLANKYTKYREKEEKDRKRREANSLVIDILSGWVHPTFDPNASDDVKNKYLYEMQTAYWKSALWIDKDLLMELNKRLTNKPDAQSTNALIALARKYVQGLEEPDVTWANIVDWSHEIKR